jgi:hypothetical protein
MNLIADSGLSQLSETEGWIFNAIFLAITLATLIVCVAPGVLLWLFVFRRSLKRKQMSFWSMLVLMAALWFGVFLFLMLLFRPLVT